MEFLQSSTFWFYMVILASILGMAAQSSVTSTFRRYSARAARSGVTAAQAAQQLMQGAGVYNVTIERARGGALSDHYDPRAKALRLSQGVYDSTSIAALGVAAHEAGHAIQHAQGYTPLMMRNSIVPLVNFGSRLSIPFVLLGLFIRSYPVALIGLVLYGFAVAFQLITLPVELNASSRAIEGLSSAGLLAADEVPGARKVLGAAASTYIVAALASLAQLMRLWSMVGRRKD